jgi:hypothetical protein
MFNPSRDEARRFLIGAWTKFRAREPLSALERMAAELIALPSRIPSDRRSARAPPRSRLAAGGRRGQPFLHLSLHLAVAEQLAIDQPPGIRAEFDRIRDRARRRARGAARAPRMPRVKWCGPRSGTERAGRAALPGVLARQT